MERSTPPEILPVRLVRIWKLFLLMFITVYLSCFMSEQCPVSQILPLIERREISFTKTFEEIPKARKGSTKSQSQSYGETEAKRARICSATRRQQNPKHPKKFLRHVKARQSLKASLMARQKPSVPGSARPREGSRIQNIRRNF